MADTPQIAPEAQAALDKAQARLEAGDLTAALSEYDQALQAEANNPRGVGLDETERTDEAIASYQEALRRESGGAGHPGRGLLLWRCLW